MASSKQALILRRLYRSLLKSARPFTPPSPNAIAYSCLLHRTGHQDRWMEFMRHEVADEDHEDSNDAEVDEEAARRALFRRLLYLVMNESGYGIRQTQFPSQVQPYKLYETIRSEFRKGEQDEIYSLQVRKQVAFEALRQLNQKLAYASRLEKTAPIPHPRQAAQHVSLISKTSHPSSYLQPGTYLLAHPHLGGYFHRSVICILDHYQDDDGDSGSSRLQGTYGLIVNRQSLSANGKNLCLDDILQNVPSSLQAFEDAFVREGGPVHMSIQMLHAATPEQEEETKIGGTVLSMAADDDSVETAPAYCPDRAVYYQGDLVHAANAVLSGKLEKEDVSLFVGCSIWSIGQLESEIERGCWLPCRGPPEIAQTGICEHVDGSDDDEEEKEQGRPKADLWLSMMSACGKDEAKLAHLVWNDDGRDEYGAACDNFD